MRVACEIARLPEELVLAALARTSPRGACWAAAVSPAFRAMADSDDIWAGFLPPDGLPPLADGEPPGPAPPLSKTELFLASLPAPCCSRIGSWCSSNKGVRGHLECFSEILRVVVVADNGTHRSKGDGFALGELEPSSANNGH
ncbi:putative F-box protein PP2-B12 [Hordeum vulgare]|nr:putative F-box protein PP2-B12 [Hordeum vulgare]